MRTGGRAMPFPARIVLTAAAILVLGWGTIRSLGRAAPVAADWTAAWWFVVIALALMALGVGTTLVCVLRGPRRSSGTRRSAGRRHFGL